jgi:CHAT domain-containing protein/tetratricopeptide (TPR) repeat protein
MKTSFLLIAILLNGLTLHSQNDRYTELSTQFSRLKEANNYDSALIVAKEMNAWTLKNESDTSLRYAVSFRDIGECFEFTELSDSAIHYYILSLDVLQKQQREEHLEFGRTMNYLGILYSVLGQYKAAEVYYKQALEIRKKALGEEQPDFAHSLNNLGVLYWDMGDYKAAEPFFKQALEIYKNALGEDHPDFASCLNNLGLLFTDMGDYETAESYYKQALEIYKNSLGEEHLDNAMSLNNLGILYLKMGDYKAAEPYFKQALEIYKNALGEEQPDFAHILMNLGNLYDAVGNYKAAEPYYKQTAEILKNTLGEENPSFALSLINLGILYCDMGDYKASEPLLKPALESYKNALGEEHPNYLSNETCFAYLLAKTDRENQAYYKLSDIFNKRTKQITNNFEWLTDNQKEAYWKQEREFFDQLSWFANQSCLKVSESVGLNYNASLLTKSKMLEAKISTENFYREVDEIREELAYRRRLLAKMESDGSTDKEKLDKLHHEADSLDKRLTMSWPEYAQQKKNLSITWDQVQEQLATREAAIEFVRFKNEDDSLFYYNALVLRKEDTQPQLIKLCKEKDLEGIASKMGFSAYYPLVWKPMEEVLKGITTIYYAPTGLLTIVPFPALYAPAGSGDVIAKAKTDKRGVIVEDEHAKTEANAAFLMDRYTLHQLTSTRYLAMGLKQKRTEPIAKDMAMVGGVNYDYLPGRNTVEGKKGKKDKNTTRSSESVSGKLTYLEGTKTEVEQINSSVAQSSWTSSLLLGNNATEENMTQFEGKNAKAILHLATHGYAFPEFDYNDTTISKNSFRYSYRYSQNPMVRSGLILSGGNWAWTGSDTLSSLGAKQNGILTAEEVAQLNLKKTKLVVLSACETGLGKIDGSEGTFGLKRGFKLAGVEQMIVSLWSVPDKETMELMTLFYTDLTKTLNPIASFENAQREMRNKYPTEPEKWAGFVMVR